MFGGGSADWRKLFKSASPCTLAGRLARAWITFFKRFKTLDRPLPCRHLGRTQGFWLSFLALFEACFAFFLALNASFPAETINIAKVRLEQPLSNETALARAWIFLLGTFLPPFLLH